MVAEQAKASEAMKATLGQAGISSLVGMAAEQAKASEAMKAALGQAGISSLVGMAAEQAKAMKATLGRGMSSLVGMAAEQAKASEAMKAALGQAGISSLVGMAATTNSMAAAVLHAGVMQATIPVARQFNEELPGELWSQLVERGFAAAESGGHVVGTGEAHPDNDATQLPAEVILLAGMLGFVLVVALLSLGAADVLSGATAATADSATSTARLAAGAAEACSEALPDVENLAVWLTVLIWIVRTFNTQTADRQR